MKRNFSIELYIKATVWLIVRYLAEIWPVQNLRLVDAFQSSFSDNTNLICNNLLLGLLSEETTGLFQDLSTAAAPQGNCMQPFSCQITLNTLHYLVPFVLGDELFLMIEERDLNYLSANYFKLTLENSCPLIFYSRKTEPKLRHCPKTQLSGENVPVSLM